METKTEINPNEFRTLYRPRFADWLIACLFFLTFGLGLPSMLVEKSLDVWGKNILSLDSIERFFGCVVVIGMEIILLKECLKSWLSEVSVNSMRLKLKILSFEKIIEWKTLHSISLSPNSWGTVDLYLFFPNKKKIRFWSAFGPASRFIYQGIKEFRPDLIDELKKQGKMHEYKGVFI